MADVRKSVRELFDAAMDIAPGEDRRAFLDKVCAGDSARRQELEELVAAHETAGGFLADPPRDPTPDSAAVSVREGDCIGRYKLLQKLGEGGCGVVYMAEQMEPVRRRVALKVIKLGMDTRSVIARFEAERQALALMDHANIARVLDAGATETGRPYFVMELVRGIRITDYCVKHQLPTQTRLELFIQVCHAVQHAHQKGVIHRDLKPSNVLVTSNDGVPLPKVIDFGIAKATADVQLTDKTMFTRFEMFLGTPAYMSPEQAEFNASDIDTRTDIYSLGVLLYELLTGHPPFDADTWLKSGIDAMRKAIRETEPARPSTRLTMELAAGAAGGKQPNRALPTRELIQQLRGDLDWIVLKALEKDRTRRYETANALAADIQRHLRDEPVLARPPSPLYLFRKLARRHRPAFAAAGAIGLILIGGIIFTTWEAVRTARAERVQRDLRQKAESNQRQAEQARHEADLANRRLSRDLFQREWQDAEALLEQGRIPSALAWFARAARQHPGAPATQARLLSILTERRFVLPVSAPYVHDAALSSAAFTADQRHLVTSSRDGLVRVWRFGSAEEPLILPRKFTTPSATVVAPGNHILVGDADDLSLWDLAGNPLAQASAPGRMRGLIPVTADGRLAAVHGVGASPCLWDTATLKRVRGPFPEANANHGVMALSPDGRYLLAFDHQSRLCAWDTSSGRKVWWLHTPQEQSGDWIETFAFHPHGDRLLVSRTDGAAGGELSIWPFEPTTDPERPPFSPQAPLLVLPVRSRVTALVFSKGGERIYAGDLEGRFSVLDPVTRELQLLNGEHEGFVAWLGLSADGHRLATASQDGTARIWDVRMGTPSPRFYTNGTSIWSVKFSPDSRSFVHGGRSTAQIRDTDTGAIRHSLSLSGLVTHANFSPDGTRVAACDDTGAARVWDARTGEPVTPILLGPPSHHVSFSPDGRWLVVVTSRNLTRVYHADTGQAVGAALTNEGSALEAHFSRDGRTLVTSTARGVLEFWSMPDCRRLPRDTRHKDVIWSCRLSPDRSQVLTASRDRTVCLWELDTGRLVRRFPHDQQVLNAEFSPDGLRVLTGDAGRRAHVWDAKDGRRLFTLTAHPGAVWYTLFSSDGRLLLTGDDAGYARIWEAASGLPLSGWVRNGTSLKHSQFSPDGRWAATAANDGTVRVWPVVLAPYNSPGVGWLPDLAEAIAGRRLRDDGTSQSVPAERWQAIHASLAFLSGDDFYTRWSRWFLHDRWQEQPAAFLP